MKCLAVCQDELIIRVLDEILLPSFEVEFVVENKTLARRLGDAGIHITAGDLKRVDTYLKADLTPNTCIIIEDNGRRSLRRILEAIRDAGGTLIYVLGVGAPQPERREEELKALFPEVAYLTMAELFGGPLRTEFSRSLTRARVQQYQRYFSDADRVLILLHHDPDPDAMASGLAVRNLLRRTKATAIIGAIQGVTRPENLRMANLLDIHVETITPADLKTFDRIALVDVQPHYFSGLVDRVDLVIDHHPETTGWTAMFKDIRPDYGSTCTILTEHLRAVDVNISERTATAMLYAIKSDTLFFNRQANRVDLEAFSYLYPLADAALIRKMEGAEITLERLEYVVRATQRGKMREQVFCAFLGESPREDFVPYVADFFLQLEDVKWTIISGVVNESLVVAVRNLGYSRNAGEFVRKCFGEIGNAGGHRAMAKAVMPMAAFRQRFGNLQSDELNEKVLDLALQFLHEHAPAERRREPAAAAISSRP
ncbi:MAG TPA: DHH family phosphoesterase [Vicinamibacterales bacterium]|jgi:nanoRNase/pAp phosphatase (c-di-AMP/oligoRNAs hydrolase)|nr:DHH family phosphoesterase [Vicinamibacterales bacterium]